MNQPTHTQVLEALQDLGETQFLIADTLRGLGIKGKRKSCCYCVIAQYLNSKFTGSFFSVTSTFVEWGDRYPNSRATTPENIAYFIATFDEGAYPDLVEAA